MKMLLKHNDIQVGDWISFYLNDNLVIREVHYIIKDDCGYIFFATKDCEVREPLIIENRHKHQLL